MSDEHLLAEKALSALSGNIMLAVSRDLVCKEVAGNVFGSQDRLLTPASKSFNRQGIICELSSSLCREYQIAREALRARLHWCKGMQRTRGPSAKRL